MKKLSNRRKNFFANELHRQTFLLVFLAAILPAFIVTVCLYYLIFGVTSAQVGFPEAIAYNIIPAAKRVTAILLITAPVTILAILILAYNITHRIVGPFDRIVAELDGHIENRRKGHIKIRQADKFHALVEKINKLLDKIKLPVD
jgi:nitrogen fixation/metabolism regulation signal transduction histidine kinase